jgi:hypothetical protein
MTKASHFLPDDLLWAEGGHASNVVLTALADGETAIVPPTVRAHVEGCTTCTTHLGHAALLSLHTQREVGALREAAAVAARHPFPRLAIALGLLVAAAGMVPTFTSDAAEAKAFATHDLPLVLRGLETLGGKLLEPGSSFALVLTYATAGALIVMAVALVRLLPKKEVSR